MATRAQMRRQQEWDDYQEARRALYADNPGTGSMPPEACYAPRRPAPVPRAPTGMAPQRLVF